MTVAELFLCSGCDRELASASTMPSVIVIAFSFVIASSETLMDCTCT